MATVWVLTFPNGDAPLSSNRRVHWRRKHEQQAWWSGATQILVREAHVPHLSRCELIVNITPPDARRRDEDNYVAHLLKPIKDGLVRAGVIDDDTNRYVEWKVRLLEPTPSRRRAWRVVAYIRELEVVP